jgi:hypothetical protein
MTAIFIVQNPNDYLKSKGNDLHEFTNCIYPGVIFAVAIIFKHDFSEAK